MMLPASLAGDSVWQVESSLCILGCCTTGSPCGNWHLFTVCFLVLILALCAPAFPRRICHRPCSCTGPLPNMCTAEHNYGNCWKDTINGKLYTACKDTIKLYKWQSQYGILNETTPTFECSCPACFRELPGGGCEPACDLSHCDGQLGCFGPVPEPGGSGSHSSKGECSL